MKIFKKDKAKSHSRFERKSEPEEFMPRKKKSLGQHFLRKQSVIDHMIDKVVVAPETSVLEIGCGDGFLTQGILSQTRCKALVCYEIDRDWADYVRQRIRDPRLTIKLKNILEVHFAEELATDRPWVLLANLPYQITFPIVFLIQQNKALFQEGVVMVQEEVAQKIVAKRGKGYSPTSIFLQYHFVWELLEKIEPGAFSPPPKVYSRLLYFKPRFDAPEIPEADDFWKFLKLCFGSPRQTLRNNLKTSHYSTNIAFSTDLLNLRAQQLSFADFLVIWKEIISQR